MWKNEKLLSYIIFIDLWDRKPETVVWYLDVLQFEKKMVFITALSLNSISYLESLRLLYYVPQFFLINRRKAW